MAEVTDSLALLSLEDDLTCSICLCPFSEPVSLKCGHSFCRACLDETWSSTSAYFCPHCREHYFTKPELKKNTVLSAVVETFRTKAGSGAGSDVASGTAGAMSSPRPELQPKPIMCNMCSEVKAVKTCLTCMMSFCSQHVRPHQENSLFRAHELCEPLADLTERLCPEHGKLMEFFCARHERSICSSCLQQNHKDCGFSSFAERRLKIETDLRDKLNFLDGKTEKNQQVLMQMREQQAKLKETAVLRKRAMEAEYRQIHEMLQRDEREAMDALNKDLESGTSKLNTLMKKFNQNIEKMNSSRDEINNLLVKSDSLDFLQASVDLPSVVNFDPYSPRINLDSKRVIAFHSSIVSLKEQINKLLCEPVENRISLLKPVSGNPNPGENETTCKSDKGKNKTGVRGASGNLLNPREPVSGNPNPGENETTCKSDKGKNKTGVRGASGNLLNPREPVSGNPNPGENETTCKSDKGKNKTGVRGVSCNRLNPREPGSTPGEDPVTSNSGSQPKGGAGGGKRKPNTRDKRENRNCKDHNERKDHSEHKDQKSEKNWKSPSKGMNSTFSRSMDNLDNPSNAPLFSVPVDLNQPSTIGPVTRSDLLKYTTILTFDIRTAHKRVMLSENNTRASVSDEPSPYSDIPPRFTVCSQVLCNQGFSRGRHYWEVKMSNNNFCCLGLAYGSIDRKGPSSRLGRNAQSWCIEWFNVKLSAWHNSSETVLVNPDPGLVGVLLDCDIGCATFYNVHGRAYPLHTFVFPFTEPVYPAFWIFSSGSSITLCKLDN